MSSTYKFKVGDIVEHIGGRGNTGKVTRVTADKITVVFEDSSKDYNYNSNTRSLRLVKEKTVETIYKYPIYKQYKKSALVIKFTSLREGVVEIGDGKHRHKGESLGLLTPHTDKTTWENYPPEPNTKHICEVLEEKVNLETAIKFAKNYTEWASSKYYSDSINNVGSLMNVFCWSESKEGHTFWSKIQACVMGVKATAAYSTFINYANMALPEEVKEIEEQLTSTKELKTKPIQTKTENTIMTNLKTTATSVATQNKDAIKVAAKLEAGKIINKQVIKQLTPHLPFFVQGYAKSPLAPVIVANIVAMVGYHTNNEKVRKVGELMLLGAADITVQSFNLDKIIDDILKGVKLPAGILDANDN